MGIRNLAILTLVLLGMAVPVPAIASPTQFGDSGLFSQPGAETLNSGNICIGLWGNCSSSDGSRATIAPATLTLGLGSFLEAYGSYPNLLFNDSETASDRGYANVGFKLRVLGKRSSTFKLALDAQMRRTVSKDIDYDGLTDKGFRAVVSIKPNGFGIHANVGMITPESPQYVTYDDQMVYGGGIEYSPTNRIRFLAEMGIETAKQPGLADQSEFLAGFQYYLSPHLTLNVAAGAGFSDVSPDWRTIVGFSSCQGIGTYQTPVPRQVQKVEAPAEKKPEKVSKVKTLTPLIPKPKAAEAEGTSQFEIPVGDKPEEIVLAPAAAPLPALAAQELPAAAIVEPQIAVTAAPEAPISAAAMAAGVPLLQAAPQLAGVVAPAPTSTAVPVSAAPLKPAPPTITAPVAASTAAGTKAVLYRKFRLPANVTYPYDEDILSDGGKKAIQEVVDVIRRETGWVAIRVDGFTDARGSDDYNLKLGLRRAISAATYMVTQLGVDPAAIFVRSSGEGDPIATNETEEGRSLNRRAEVLLFIPKE